MMCWLVGFKSFWVQRFFVFLSIGTDASEPAACCHIFILSNEKFTRNPFHLIKSQHKNLTIGNILDSSSDPQSLVAGLSLRRTRGGCFGGVLVVESVQTLGLGAVKVEPPVTDEDSLVEHGAVRAEDAVGLQAIRAIVGTDVERLALCGGVGIVSSFHQAIAGEPSVRYLGVDGIVLPRDPGDVHLKAPNIVIAGSAGRVGAVLLLCEGKGDAEGSKGDPSPNAAHPSTQPAQLRQVDPGGRALYQVEPLPAFSWEKGKPQRGELIWTMLVGHSTALNYIFMLFGFGNVNDRHRNKNIKRSSGWC